MYCVNCGNPLPDTAKFCPKCGRAVSPAKKNVSQTVVKTPDIRQAKPAAAAARNTNTAGSPLIDMLTIDRILGAVSFVLMIVVMFVPIASRDFLIYREYSTLFTIFGDNAAGLNTTFGIAYILFALLFVVFKFVWKTKKPSTIGCTLSWILFGFVGVSLIPGSHSDSSGVLYLGAGFYLWAAACILQCVSLGLDHRKYEADDDYVTDTQTQTREWT